MIMLFVTIRSWAPSDVPITDELMSSTSGTAVGYLLYYYCRILGVGCRGIKYEPQQYALCHPSTFALHHAARAVRNNKIGQHPLPSRPFTPAFLRLLHLLFLVFGQHVGCTYKLEPQPSAASKIGVSYGSSSVGMSVFHE